MPPPPPATAFEHPWHALVLAIRQEHPDWIPAQIATHLGADYIHVSGRSVKAFLEKHRAASTAPAAEPPPAGEPLDDPWS